MNIDQLLINGVTPVGGFMFGGLRVIITPDQPKMQLSERVKEVLSPEFAAETNAWMLSFFGVTNILKDGQALTSELMGTVTMNPRTFDRLKKMAKSQARKY